MLRAMQNEAGRQIVRGLTADDGALPAQLRERLRDFEQAGNKQ